MNPMRFALLITSCIAVARMNVRLKIQNLGGERPPCRHIFNMIMISMQ
ncbi:hypothetical protein Desti_1339 [Desulfomonile tiedjei DSM 6799]|uniref:Uncharacterized protein n=1 Tax=Desulfomonile tiedjei (strain ATCC 49306 / DSM 6799 / DCB-1) TaxID=706587 RepID=I4C3B1_DESTA|nr:hypothetical protein Desti_1339 [Desulfomonile tiedjei DSM 6799]